MALSIRNSIISFSLALLGLMAAASGHASYLDRGCEDQVLSLNSSVKFELIMAELERIGLPVLLKDYKKNQIDIQFSQPSQFKNSEVDWKSGLLGRRILVVRDLPWTTLKDRQLSAWKTAVGLYQLQLIRRWYVYRSASKADLDADMQTLASTLTELRGKELDRGHVTSYLKRAKSIALAIILSGFVQTTLYTTLPTHVEVDPPYTSLTENLDQKLVAEKLRLERSIVILESNKQANQEELSELKIELQELCQTFENICQAPIVQK